MSWVVGSRRDPLARLPPDAQVQPTPPLARQGLRGGPDFSPSLQASDPAISGLDALARAMSPFAIWTEPPPFLPGALRSPGTVTAFGEGLRSVGSAADPTARRAASPAYVAGQAPSSSGPQRSRADLSAPQISDRDTALSIQSQVAEARGIPPLVLLINPETMTISRSKLAQLQDRSRYGFIYQPWGDEPVKVAFTARCGGFYSPGRGLHVKSRDNSAAWQSMMSLLLLYKNNSYTQDVLGGSYSPLLVGRVGIRYDGWVYRGHLDDLSWTEEEGKPHGALAFEVSMTATTIVDTSPLPLTVLPLRGPNGQGLLPFAPAREGGSPLEGIGGGPPAATPPPSPRPQASDSPAPFLF